MFLIVTLVVVTVDVEIGVEVEMVVDVVVEAGSLVLVGKVAGELPSLRITCVYFYFSF